MRKPRSRRRLLRALQEVAKVQIESRRVRRGRRVHWLELVKVCRTPVGYLIIESARASVCNIQEFFDQQEAWHYFRTDGAAVALPPALAALLRTPGRIELTTRDRLFTALDKMPGVQHVHARRRVYDPATRRLDRLDVFMLRRSPPAYLLVRCSQRRVVELQEFASRVEALEALETNGAPIKLPPAVAALVR